MSSEHSAQITAEVVKEILEVTCVKEAVQPAAQEFGKAAAPAGKALGETVTELAVAGKVIVHWTLANIARGYQLIRAYVGPRVAEILRDVPKERLQLPAPRVAVPALEGMAVVADDEDLREMFAKLIATSMDSRTAGDAHPAFAEIVRQLTPDEAKIIRHIASVRYIPTVTATLTDYSGPADERRATIVAERAFVLPTEMLELEDAGAARDGIVNLVRLGIIEPNDDKFFYDDPRYTELIEHPEMKAVTEGKGQHVEFTKGGMYLTSFGQRFLRACVLAHGQMRPTPTGKIICVDNDDFEPIPNADQDRPE